jgi:hypothetical protein
LQQQLLLLQPPLLQPPLLRQLHPSGYTYQHPPSLQKLLLLLLRYCLLQ